jgi:hypothetical protein
MRPERLQVATIALSENSIALTLSDGRSLDCKIKVCLGFDSPVCIAAPSNGLCKSAAIAKVSSSLFVTIATRAVQIWELSVQSLKIKMLITISPIDETPKFAKIMTYNITSSRAVFTIAYISNFDELKMLSLNLSLNDQYRYSRNPQRGEIVIDKHVDPEFIPILTNSKYTQFVTYKKDNTIYTKLIQFFKEGAEVDLKPITLGRGAIAVASGDGSNNENPTGSNVLHLNFDTFERSTNYYLVKSFGGLKPFGIVMNTNSRDNRRDVYFAGVVNHKRDWDVGVTLYAHPNGKVNTIYGENAVKVGTTISPTEMLITLDKA